MQKTGITLSLITLTMITLLILQIGCSKTQHNAIIEVIDGITYVHNADIPFSDLELEPEFSLTGDDYCDYIMSPDLFNVDSEGNIFLIDNGENTISKFSKEGEHIQTFQANGVGPGEFDIIGRMDIFPNGDMIVADEMNYRYQLLDKNFKFIDSIKLNKTYAFNCYVLDNDTFVINGAPFGVSIQAGTPLMQAFSKEMNSVWECKAQDERDFTGAYFATGYYTLAVNTQNKVVVAAYLDNNISVYQNGIKSIQIDRSLPYKTTNKVTSSTIKKNGGYATMFESRPVSAAVCTDSRDNIYVLRFPDKSETKAENLEEGEFLAILEFYNPEGVLFKKSKIKGASGRSDMKIDKEDNFYLLNYHEDGNVLTRYKPMEI